MHDFLWFFTSDCRFMLMTETTWCRVVHKAEISTNCSAGLASYITLSLKTSRPIRAQMTIELWDTSALLLVILSHV
jgi:hypothetical protein